MISNTSRNGWPSRDSSTPNVGSELDDPKISLVTYDLDTFDVLKSPPYLAVAGDNLSPWSKRMIGKCERIARIDAEQLPPGREVGPQDAGGMLVIAMNVLPEVEAEFNAWYDEEHIPNLRTVPGMLCARRFKSELGATPLYRRLSSEYSGGPGFRCLGQRHHYPLAAKDEAADSRSVETRAAPLSTPGMRGS